MARKQESEKFTGLVGTYSWSNKLAFDPTASPLNTSPLANPYQGDKLGGGIPTTSTSGPPRLTKVVHMRSITSAAKGKVGGTPYNYVIGRPIFSFDFTDPEEYGDGQLQSVRKIQKAKVVLNIESVATGNSKTGPNPPTSITIALMCTKQQPSIVTTSKPGKGGPVVTTRHSCPPAAQGLALGGIASEHPSGLGATSKIISSTNTVSVGDTGQIGFNLPRPMLDELAAAMQHKRYFSVFVVDMATYKGGVALAGFEGSQTIAFHGATTDTALHPILDFTYKLDNNKVNTGGGLSRTTKTGFMLENVFSGTNSGFSE